jgi:hypothetical protein
MEAPEFSFEMKVKSGHRGPEAFAALGLFGRVQQVLEASSCSRDLGRSYGQ